MKLPVSLTRRGRNLLIAAALIVVLWFAVGLRDLWYLAALFVSFVVVSLLIALLLPLAARLRVSLSVSSPTPMVGDEVELRALVTHRLPFRVSATVTWQIESARRPTESLPLPVVIARAGTKHSDTSRAGAPTLAAALWRPARRGPTVASVPRVVVVDPLGLIQRRIRLEATQQLLVLPRPLDDTHAPSSGDEVESSDWSEARLLQVQSTGSPGGAVREYRWGDTARQIHWKQSARQGELLVNLHERNTQSERTLLLINDPAAYQPVARFELAVSAAAALAAEWLRDDVAVRLQLDGGAPHLCTTLSQALRALALVELSEPGESSLDTRRALPSAIITGALTELLVERLRTEPAGGNVYVTREADTRRIAAPWVPVTISAGGRRRPEGRGHD